MSSQSDRFDTWAVGWAQAAWDELASPYPSPSPSAYQVLASTASDSSTWPSQSLSAPSQVSRALGLLTEEVSSQSLLLPT